MEFQIRAKSENQGYTEERNASKRETHIRVHRKDLLPESLLAYNLPWDWDENDPNYLLIKRWISQRLRQELFAHTKRIREERGHARQFKKNILEKESKPAEEKEIMREKTDHKDRNVEPTKGSNEEENAKSIKVHKRYLLPETLKAYNLPWDWDDSDPNYIVIKRWITESFREDLFAHTRRQKLLAKEKLVRRDSIAEQRSPMNAPLLQQKHNYSRSKCCRCEGNLSADVSLKHSADKRSADECRNSLHRGNFSRRIDVASSRIPGYGKTILYRTDPTEEKQKPQFSWVHAEQEIQDFEEFIRFASSVSVLTDDDRALVLSLMKKIRLKAHASRCIATNHIFRCDGVDSSILDETRNEKSAILIRFPYSTIQKLSHRSRTLGKYHYGQQSTRKRDLNQVVQKMNLFPAGHVVHVSELWAVIVNFQYIITSAPVSLLDENSSSYEILSPPAVDSCLSLSNICVLDPKQRLFSFPVEICKTFAALRHTIAENCLPSNLQEKGYDFEILTTDDVAVKPDEWLTIISTHRSTVFRIKVRLLFPEIKQEPIQTEDDNLIVVEEDGDEENGSTEENQHAHRAFFKYDYPVQGEEKGVVRSMGKQAKHTTTSSYVVNIAESSNNKKPPELSVHFDPGISASHLDKDGAARRISSFKYRQNTEERQFEEEPRQVQRSATLCSLLGGSPSLSMPSYGPKTELSLEFPPVFTWSSHKKSSGQESSSEKEEMIKHVLSHISKNILEDKGDVSQAIYKRATVSSHFGVNQAMKQKLNISLPVLISRGRQQDVPPDTPWWEVSLKDSIGGMSRLLNFFMPLEFPCDVANKFWGGVHSLVTTLPQICDSSKMTELTKRTQRRRMTETYFIVDLKDEKLADLRRETDMKMLTEDISDCRKCSKNRQYSTRSEALEHLASYHFKDANGEQPTSYQSSWVMTYGEYLTFICRTDGQKILHQLQEHLTILEEMALQIQNDVSENRDFNRETYRVPSTLVKTFQNLLMMVLTAASIAKISYQARKAHTDPEPPTSFLTLDHFRTFTTFGAQAEDFMSQAESSIVLMTRTDETSDVITYEVVSPSLVVALVMDELHCRDSDHNPINIVDVYRSYMQRLQFKAIQNPHRRMLQDIYTFQEELTMTYKILVLQIDTLYNYINVLRPSSFNMANETRVSSFNLERAQLEKLVDRLDADLGVIDGLVDLIESLATMTRNGIDVRQEDQGKAILVFTIVTVVFTPLSFVTSFFGMNTVDIRNTTNNQALFWTISIPLTFGIIAIVFSAVFQAERGRELLETLFRSGSSQRDISNDIAFYEIQSKYASNGDPDRRTWKRFWRLPWTRKKGLEDWKMASDLTLKV